MLFPRVRTGLRRILRADRLTPHATGLVPLATAGAIGYSMLIPAVELWRYAQNSPDAVHTWIGVTATLGYLPLHIRHVRYAAQGTRPPGAVWTVAGMAIVIVVVLPYLGAFWLGQFHALAVSVLIVLRPPLSVVLFAGIVAAQTPLSIVLDNAEMAPFFTIAIALKGLPVFLLIWLVGAVRRLGAARLALADRAVGRERSRIDDELRRTVGAALESIAGRGENAATLAVRDPAAAQAELRILVQASRGALAEARRLIGSYRRASLAAELGTAATLLAAAGIDSRVVVPDGELPDTVDQTVRAALRTDVVRLLRDDTVRRCVIEVTRRDGRLRLAVHAGDDASDDSGAGNEGGS